MYDTSTTENNITWWENDGSENFVRHIIDDNVDSVYSVYATDVDGDGEQDVLGAAAAEGFFWWENTRLGDEGPVTLDVLDPQGTPVTQLITNTNGWPTPNPLTVTVTLNCPAEGPDCGNQFHLTLDSNLPIPSEDAARFYVYERDLNSDGGVQISCTEITDGPSSSQYSYTIYDDECFDDPVFGTLTLSAGETKTMSWQVWIQPSQAADLEVSAFWGTSFPNVGETVSQTVQIPLAQIHPVGLLEGFFGFSENFVALHFEPLIITLEKIGYQRDRTLFVGHYDFVGDIFDAAEELSDQFINWQTDARQIDWVNKFPDEQEGFLDLVALSQGALVARAYAQTGNYPVDLHRLLLVGGPNRGAPYVYRAREGLEADAGLWQLGLDYVIPLQALACDRATVVIGPSGPERIYVDTTDRYETLHDLDCGIYFFPQTLPAPPNNLAYLFDNNADYPFGRQINPLLEAQSVDPQDDPWWSPANPNPSTTYLNLNSSINLDILSSRINGFNNLYLFYNDAINEAQGYEVEPNTGFEPLWRNGRVADPLSFLGPSDGSIPFYSARAADLWSDSPEENLNVEDVPGNERDEIHANLPVYPESQQKIARVLTGVTPPFTTPLNPMSSYIQTGEITPGLVKELAGLFITGMSPIELSIVDPAGRRLGYDMATGQIINEIPTGVYDHPPDGSANLWIFDPLSGDYSFTVTGTGVGNYTILAQFVDSQGSAPIFYKQGVTQLGEVQAITLTVPITSGGIVYPPVFAFQEVDGQIVMEGEHFTEYASHGARPWITQTNISGYVGTGYLDAPLDTGLQFTTPYTSSSPELRYTINFTTTGTYYVWLRGYASDAGGDSIYIGLDQQPVTGLTGFGPREWDWVSKSTGGGMVALEVTQPGLHVLHLWMREDGLRLDRILLTTNSNYNPSGSGPAESERSRNLN